MWGALIGGAFSYLGASKTAKAQKNALYLQMKQIADTGNRLDSDYAAIIEQLMGNKGAYAGSRVQAAEYNPVSLSDSLARTISANAGNFGAASQLARRTNQDTLANDFSRINQFSPDILRTLSSLSGQANSLSQGNLPADFLQDIVSRRATSSAAAGIPGGAGPATLRDLGLNSLDAINRGASLFETVLKGAEAISPISRQISANQYQIDPNTGLQMDLQQALLSQQSEQNKYNLAAAPDPAMALALQLQIQQANNRASIGSQVAGLNQPITMPYAQIYGQIGSGIGQGLGNLFGGMFGGGSKQKETRNPGDYGGGGGGNSNYFSF